MHNDPDILALVAVAVRTAHAASNDVVARELDAIAHDIDISNQDPTNRLGSGVERLSDGTSRIWAAAWLREAKWRLERIGSDALPERMRTAGDEKGD